MECYVYNAANFIIGYATLKILRFGGNLLGDDGMQLILKGFQDNNVLVDLRVWNCKLSAKGSLVVNIVKWHDIFKEISPAHLIKYGSSKD